MKSLSVIFFIGTLTVAMTNQLQLINNGYEGVLIKIEDHVSERLCNQIYVGIKVNFIQFLVLFR